MGVGVFTPVTPVPLRRMGPIVVRSAVDSILHRLLRVETQPLLVIRLCRHFHAHTLIIILDSLFLFEHFFLYVSLGLIHEHFDPESGSEHCRFPSYYEGIRQNPSTINPFKVTEVVFKRFTSILSRSMSSSPLGLQKESCRAPLTHTY